MIGSKFERYNSVQSKVTSKWLALNGNDSAKIRLHMRLENIIGPKKYKQAQIKKVNNDNKKPIKNS